MGLGFEHRYFPIVAASLPFAIGSLVSHYREHLNAIRYRWAPLILLLCLPLNWYIFVRYGLWIHGQEWLRELGFYANMLICVALLLSLLPR